MRYYHWIDEAAGHEKKRTMKGKEIILGDYKVNINIKKITQKKIPKKEHEVT